MNQILVEGQAKPSKNITITLEGLGVPPLTYAQSGWPQVNHVVLKNLCGNPRDNPPSYGKLFDFFGRNDEAKFVSSSAISLVLLVFKILFKIIKFDIMMIMVPDNLKSYNHSWD